MKPFVFPDYEFVIFVHPTVLLLSTVHYSKAVFPNDACLINQAVGA